MFDSFCPYTLLTVKYEPSQEFHLKTFVYRIKTTAGNYIAHCEEYTDDVYVVKFYPAFLKRHDKKYQVITNQNVMPQVIGTILRIMIYHLSLVPGASFGFVASSSVIGQFTERKSNNQRFRIYRQVMQNFFGKDVFRHFRDEVNSAYLMINKSKNVPVLLSFLRQSFSDLYPGLVDLDFKDF